MYRPRLQNADRFLLIAALGSLIGDYMTGATPSCVSGDMIKKAEKLQKQLGRRQRRIGKNG